jgi:hypothetical protein
MKSQVVRWTAAAALAILTTTAAWAADIDGKWTWKTNFQGNERTNNLELKQEGEKLTGKMEGRDGNKIDIKEGTIKGSEIAFVVIRERNGNEFKIRYKGKLEGDKITGTTTTNFNGEERMREWIATRVK